MPQFQTILEAKTFAETVANGPFSFQIHGIQWTALQYGDLFNHATWVTKLANSMIVDGDFLYSRLGVGTWVN